MKRGIFTYDTAGNRLTVLFQNPDASTASGWIDLGLNTMTYDASGNMLSRFMQMYMPDSLGVYSWVSVEKWENTFNAANKAVSTATYWYGGDTTATLNRLDSFFYDAHNNLTLTNSRMRDVTGALANYRSYHYEYNSYDQLTALYTNTWNPATHAWVISPDISTPDYIRRFHYSDTANDPFDPIPHYTPQSVEETVRSGCDLNVFPSPANGTLNLDITWNTVQQFSIQVLDVQGRIWAQWNVAACTHYADVLPVAQMPAGNYVLRVTGATGAQVRQFVVGR
jgi:hypothetical protein